MPTTLQVKTALLLTGLVSTSIGVFAQNGNQNQDNQGQNGFPPGANGGTNQNGNGRHGGGGGGTANLINHGGPVLTSPTDFHFVWWGSWGASGDTQAILRDFVSGLGGISLFTMMDQYVATNATVGLSYPHTDYTDISAPPSHGPSVSTIVSEVCKVVTASGTPDPTAMYAVLTSNFPNGANYCAWHASGTCAGKTIQVIYQPNPANVLGCSTGVYPNNNQQADSTANTLSHEIFETVTDPHGNAWYDQNGEEIGDKCAWTFTPAVAGQNYTNKIGSFKYYIQREWSNSAGCVQN